MNGWLNAIGKMKKKLLFVIGMFAGGGAEKVLVNMVNQMDLSKYDITVYCVFNTGRRPKLKKGVKLYYSFKVGISSNDTIKGKSLKAVVLNTLFTYGWKWMPMKLFYRFAIREKYDYEIAYAEGIPHKIVAASSNDNSKKYGWVHIDLTVTKRALEFFKSEKEERKCYKKMDKLVFVSDYAKDRFISKYGFEEKCVTKYNVNQNQLILDMSKENVNMTCTYRPLLVTVGRLHEQKGYDRLLKCVNKLKNRGYKFEVWILGDGAKKIDYEQYIDNHHLEDYVKLLGFQDNPYKYIKMADWFIAPSRYEGYSTVVSEAYILQKPVMVTDCSGMGELTENGKYGIMVDNSLEGIESGLERILALQAERYDKYLMLAKERSAYFEVDKRMEDLCELF